MVSRKRTPHETQSINIAPNLVRRFFYPFWAGQNKNKLFI
ncbi:hypothetical protein PESP_a1155 [Pseudoalteromonas espejiana DSM 9414]|nr:hypothetical protein PESP_a1155 [Pseudoalteromonas espejiana DSM 9414]